MKKILFICGSLNQTTQMHKIAQHLSTEHECYFTPYYADGLVNLLSQMGLLNFTVLGGRHRHETDKYLKQHNLSVDLRGEKNNYDLVVSCSDLIIQKNIRKKRLILVQEGITEPEGLVYKLVRWLKLPRYLANTATSGLSNAYDIFFDNMKEFHQNNFPFHGHVLVATSPLRETFRFDDRKSFIQKCKRIAGNRMLIFKLHPLENSERAIREIINIAPKAIVYTHGNISHLIANAEAVITQQSTVTFVAVALNKEVHTNLDVAELKRLMPIQNGDSSASHIARICSRMLHNPTQELARIRSGYRSRVIEEPY